MCLPHLYKSNGCSLRKPQRSTHIHNCCHKELACTLERLQPELRYCFAWFSSFVEEEWDKHWQMHLKSITSKRCVSITYCYTLVRPAFCPFCMGDNRLDVSSYMSSESSFTDTAADDSPQDLPELTHSEPTSPPDADESYMTTDISPSENFLEPLKDLPETKIDGCELPSLAHDALFSLYLRTRSPSCSFAKGIWDNNNNDGSLASQTVTPSDICLSTVEDIHLAESIDHNTIKPENVSVKTKKPRITLRIRQPEPRPKSRKLLRLSQPKQALAQNSSPRKPGVNDRKKLRTWIYFHRKHRFRVAWKDSGYPGPVSRSFCIFALC